MIGIYKITNKINGKLYIGFSNNIERRFREHKYRGTQYEKNPEWDKPLYRAMRKYGIENFSFEIIEECTIETADEREIYWINYYDSYNRGYNATTGGSNPTKYKALVGEDSPRAKLTQQEVVFCRLEYQKGSRAKEIYESMFKDKIAYSGFERMWHGKTWKHVMPEVFQNNPHPSQKLTIEEIKLIKEMYKTKTCAEIYHVFKHKVSRTTINDICNNRRYGDIK